jgi:hypothetical protein
MHCHGGQMLMDQDLEEEIQYKLSSHLIKLNLVRNKFHFY